MYTTNIAGSSSKRIPPQFEISHHHVCSSESEIKNNLDTTLKAALIKFSENKMLSRDEALKMYAYFNHEITNVNCNELTHEDYADLISKNCISLNDIPAELLTYEICLNACILNWCNLRHVPKFFANANLYLQACTQNAYALEETPLIYITKELIKALPELNCDSLDYIPDEFKDYSVYCKACESSSYSIKCIAKDHPNYEDFLDLTTKIHGVHLEYFDEKKITPTLCQQACARDGSQLEHVPLALRNFQLCKTAVQTSYLALGALPAHLTTKEQQQLYELGCATNFSALYYVPESFKTEELCLLAAKSGRIDPKLLPKNLSDTTLKSIFESACQHQCQNLNTFPEQFITQELCYLNASHDGFTFRNIPEKFWNDEIWNIAKSTSYFVLYYLNHQLFDRFKHLIDFVPKKTQLNLLCSPLSIEQKLALIDFVDSKIYEAQPIVNSAKLIEIKSPLSFSVKNSYIYDLMKNAYDNTSLNLKLLDLGKSLQQYISRLLSLPSNPAFDMQNIFAQHKCNMVGGRTLAFNIANDKALYLKFKKTGESIKELQKEGAVYSFINNDSYLKSKLKSELPYSIFLEKILLTNELKEQIKKSDDNIEMIAEGDNHYVFALTFHASLNYARYAHLLDLSNEQGDFFHKPEQGILTACYDAGVLASMGVILPSLLPAFHDTSSKRRWIALHSTFKTNGINHPGTFGAWNTTASERPDLGYGGIRDLGDHEMFGEIKIYLQQIETEMADKYHPDEVLQRLGFCNAICETLLSALIVRSRLQQQSNAYHYKNRRCLNDTKIFIESICNQFLSGFYDRESIKPISLLQSLLQLDETKYTQWLERSALETVYWTAAQAGVDKVTLENLGFEQDCYIKHIEKEGIASQALYPDKNKIRQYNFFNVDDKLNLGANNTSFPLLTLMNGLTLLCINLLAQK